MAKIKLEKQLYKELKEHWTFYIERIEPKYKGGIPDILVNANGNTEFVELKIGHKENGKLKIKIRPSQRIWHKKFTGISYVLVSVDDVFYLIDSWNIPNVIDGMKFEDFEQNAFFSPHMEDIAMRIC